MKILITGATGLIGHELVKLVLSKNHSVHYLTTSKDKLENKPNYQGFYWNPVQGEIDENCIKDVDAIIHLAGATIAKRWTKSYKQEIMESRTLSAALLYDLARKTPNQVKQFVSASAIGIYPESFSKIYDETTTKTDSGFLSDVVQQWEESADRFETLRIKVCKVRTAMVLSDKGGALPEIAKPIKFGLGAAIGPGKQIQPWIHIDDLAAMYCFIVENHLEGTYNALTPNPVTNQELTKILAKKLNRPLLLPNIPEFVMKLLLGEMTYLLLSSKNLSAQKIGDAGFKFKFMEIDKAISDLYQ